MLNSVPVRIFWHSLSWLTRLSILASAAMAAVMALVIILLRYWLLPDIDQYRERITASLSKAIGNTVTIGRIEGDWQGLHPHLNFVDVRILDDRQQPALVLERINSSVSWMSLLAAELRLATLEINRPEFLIRRDPGGKWFIGGLGLTTQGGDNNLADWLLRQSHMAVREALIVWVDEQRDGVPLVLRQVNLHVDSLFSRHRFALRAVPPKDLAGPLDVRGDFRGASFADLDKWQGQLFTQLDSTDVTFWRHWLELPANFNRGLGGVRSWVDIEAGGVVGITADLALRNVEARLGEDVPGISLAYMRGRVAWKVADGSLDVSTRKFSMRLKDGMELQPTDLYLRMTKAMKGKPAAGEVHANALKLETLAGLAGYLPLEAGLRSRLESYSPKGSVANLSLQWQGAFENPAGYKIKGQFEDIALRQVGNMPGFSGLSLDVDGSETSGRLSINSRRLVVDTAGIMREPLPFSILVGQAGWQRERNELMITVDNLVAVNEDLAGNVFGSYQTQAGTRGVLDLTASLTRGDVRRAARYTPLIAVNKKGSDWLHGALQAGHTGDLRVRIKGNLSNFPPGNNNKNVLFEIGGHAQDVTLEFSKDWPRIENITGEFRIRGNRLEVRAPSATMSGASLRNVTVALPDMGRADLPLEIEGEAVAESSTFLQFIQQSPVRGYTGGFTDGVSVTGNGHLSLSAHIPLRGDDAGALQAGAREGGPGQNGRRHTAVKVSGTFSMEGNDIAVGEGVPLLRNTRGALSFTESGIQARHVLSEILGGTATIDIQTAVGGEVHARVQGHNNLDALREINPHPLLNYLRGGAAWDADITVAKNSARLAIKSNLRGISSTLPQPFAKDAGETMPLLFEKMEIAEGEDLITAQLGSLANARLERREKNGEMIIERGTVNFGEQREIAEGPDADDRLSGARLPARLPRSNSGVWLAGSLPELSIQGWGNLMGQAEKPGWALPIAGANMHIGKVTGYGQIIKSLQIDAVKRGDGLAARLVSDSLNGEVAWLPHGYEKGGKFSAHLSNLYWTGDGQSGQVPPAIKTGEPGQHTNGEKTSVLRPGSLPAIEIVIEDVQVNERQFGRVDLVGYPAGEDWRMRRLNISNPDGSLAGDGLWKSGQSEQDGAQTHLNLQLKLNDAGKTLARYGYPNTVKGGSGKLAANLTWDGAPDKFNYASLNGTLKLDTGKGRFLKMEPGAGKLLSILSLQALPSRITLDFTDVFSEGFQFDSINGNAAIRDGVINSQDLQIIGSSARVTMKGGVDLNNGTQDLNVRIFPTLGDSVSLIGAFTAGPAVGVGALIVSKVLGDPLDKLVSFEYNVSGTWSEPHVVKVVKEPVPFK